MRLGAVMFILASSFLVLSVASEAQGPLPVISQSLDSLRISGFVHPGKPEVQNPVVVDIKALKLTRNDQGARRCSDCVANRHVV
jgi:hypothetical protein